MFRILNVTYVTILHFTSLFYAIIAKRGDSVPSRIGIALVNLCQDLGGAFPKAGQLLSTRADIISDRIRLPLCQLQDNVKTLPDKIVENIFKSASICLKLNFFETKPIASATVAQVHRAKREDNDRLVALKILRPGIQNRIMADCHVFQLVGKLLAKLPKMSSIPVEQALLEISEVLLLQTDFKQEMRNHRRLYTMFVNNENIIVPALHEDLCDAGIIAMDYIPGLLKINDPSLHESAAKEALTNGIRALYQMIFIDGFIHCDMHPGNVLVASGGKLVILDAGFMVALTEETRMSFATFFIAIAFRDGKTAANIVRKTAIRLPRTLNIEAFDKDICELINQVGGLKARDFQVARFVGELFSIMRKHEIYGTSQFTLIILSLLVYEGVTKQRHPELDFQQEAVPFVMKALATQKR